MIKRFTFIVIALLLPIFVFGQKKSERIYYAAAAKAFYQQGEKYYSGKKQDYIKAAEWFLKSAEMGYGDAQYMLAGMYYNGMGVIKNYHEAAKWYRLAAEQNVADAQTCLANVEKIIEEQQKNGYVQNTINTSHTGPVIITQPQPQTQPQITPQPKVGIDPVDTNIPISNNVNKNTFAILIANEDYRNESKVDYAKNDGEVFKNYCNKTLGLPKKNVHYISNATLNDLIGELDWLQQVCEAFGGEANVIFYYAGHGIPDEATSSAYLLPTDGNSRLLRTCFSINELYETLGKLPAKKVTVLMDACFSGAKRDGNMLASARGVAIKAKAGAPKGNMIVLSAAQGDETAYKYEETGHGLFTYFLLKKLQETKGNVTMGELSQYLQEQVKRYSIVENGKSQTPCVQTSEKLKGNWESLKFD